MTTLGISHLLVVLAMVLFGIIGIATGAFIVRTPYRAMQVLMPAKAPDDRPSTLLLRAYQGIGFVGGLLSVLLLSMGLVGVHVVLR